MRVCFFHVPKTAGASIKGLMQAHFGVENVFHAYENRFCTLPIDHLMRGRPIVSGHLSVRYLSNQVLENTFVFTFLRDPAERILSQYSYYRSLPAGNRDPDVDYARTLSLKDLLKLRANPGKFSAWSNLQTRMFSGCDYFRQPTAETLSRAKHNLEQFEFVGTQENLAAGAKVLLRAWGASADLELPKINQSPKRVSALEIDDETRALIKENNILDRELYAHAAELWRRRHAPTGPRNLITDLVGTVEEGSREIEIRMIAIKGDVEERRQIRRDRPWTLLLTIRSSIVENNLTVGIKVTGPTGLTLYGTNSFLRGQRIASVVGVFTVAIDFAPVRLAPGRYVLTVALHTGATSEEKCFHWIENAFELEVVPPLAPDFTGLVDLNAKFGVLPAKESTGLPSEHSSSDSEAQTSQKRD